METVIVTGGAGFIGSNFIVQDRKGHDRGYFINAQKIHEQLGWKSIYGFKQALENIIKWYLHNM